MAAMFPPPVAWQPEPGVCGSTLRMCVGEREVWVRVCTTSRQHLVGEIEGGVRTYVRLFVASCLPRQTCAPCRPLARLSNVGGVVGACRVLAVEPCSRGTCDIMRVKCRQDPPYVRSFWRPNNIRAYVSYGKRSPASPLCDYICDWSS